MARYATLLALLLLPVVSLAAPRASFTARPVQGSTCVAPCAVHFDAIGGNPTQPGASPAETTDPDFDSEYHSLHYWWDFGDPQSGDLASWAISGQSKNSAIGPMAGHTFTSPGTYTVTLTVTNPNGETDTTTRSVTVLDPLTAIGRASTYCVADHGDNPPNWTGCPLACSGADSARCLNESDWRAALSRAGTSNGARYVLFRRGDTFGTGGSAILAALPDGSAGLISAFPPANLRTNRPTAAPGISIPFQCGSNSGDGWTIAHHEFAGSGAPDYGCVRGSISVDRTTLYDVEHNCNGECVTQAVGGRDSVDQISKRRAFVEVDFNRISATGSYTFWGDAARWFMWMGGTIDHNDNITPGNTQARTYQYQWWLLQHTRWTDANNPSIQLRCLDDITGGDAEDRACHHNLISYNLFEDDVTSNLLLLRVGEDSSGSCVQAPGTGACTAAIGRYDTLVEHNFFRRWNTSGNSPLVEYTCGEWTHRGNIHEMSGGTGGGLSFIIQYAGNALESSDCRGPGNPYACCTGSGTGSCGDACPSNGMRILGNTVHFDDNHENVFTLALFHPGAAPNVDGCEGDCVVAGNLVYAPNRSASIGEGGSLDFLDNSDCSSSGQPYPCCTGPGTGTCWENVYILQGGRSPFVTDPLPPQPNSTSRDYMLDAGPDGDRARNVGSLFSSGSRATWDYVDITGQCRPDAARDAGAHESEPAANCVSASAGSPPVIPPPSPPPAAIDPPPAPFLLP